MTAREIVHILAPTRPGDLVATRLSLMAFYHTHHVKAYVLNHLIELVADLPIEINGYESLDGSIDADDILEHVLESLPIPEEALLVDLIGQRSSMRLAASRPGHSIGHKMMDDEVTGYTTVARWSLGANGKADPTHYSIRQLRAHPDYSRAMIWPLTLFRESAYRINSVASQKSVGLAPGCARGGLSKRMPTVFWQRLAQEVRVLGCTPMWFLGPDETELVPELVIDGDEVMDGGWQAVIEAHGHCGLAISNDTCHLHIRAYQDSPTLVLFRMDWATHWGSYPSRVTCLEPPRSLTVEDALEDSISWLSTHLGKPPA